MNWDDVIDRLTAADLKPIEEIYMEHYGKVLTAERPEFHGRYFRCTYGVVTPSFKPVAERARPPESYA